MMGNDSELGILDRAREAIWSVTGTNIIAGTIGGIAGVIIGHPFDTVKVRMQGANGRESYRTTWQSFQTILRNESPLGLFKGMSSPLVGVAVVNAFLFGVYGFLLDIQQPSDNIIDEQRSPSPSMGQVFLAGAGSGAVNSLISCPTELAKIQLQNQRDAALRGPIDCLGRIYRTRGIAGWYRGMGATVLRETPSYGVYFATFEYLLQQQQHAQVSSLGLMMAGGIGGVLGWISTYPIDVAKTRIQSTSNSSTPSTIACLTRAVREEGPAVLVRGLGATLIRAFPTNAAIFLAYKWTMDWLERIRPEPVIE